MLNAPTDEPIVSQTDSIHPSSPILHPSSPWSAWIRDLRMLTLVVLCWLPLRSGLLMAVYLQRVLRSDPDRPLHAMNHFFSPWMLLLLLIGPVLLAWRFVRNDECKLMNDEGSGSAASIHHSAFSIRHSWSAALIALSAALFTAAVYWAPVGSRREGRVMVVERHSEWEPTTKPYDTKWFAEPPLFDQASGYNYAAIYDYLGQYYQMSRLLEKDKIDDATLSKCNVLVIKIPTSRYTKEEAEAVVRFVEQGGGVLLVGDHTNFEGSSTAMNDITRPMGFIFRDDLLYSFNELPDQQQYIPPAVPHPIVQRMPPMDFAVSCSIDPGHSRGQSVIAPIGLWSMGPEYHHDNYMPFAQHCPEMRYGAFVQVWAARHGQGRAVAFTDSTIFSNFCAYQPGHAEVLLGMIEWLNHGNFPLNPRPWLVLLGLSSFVAGLWMIRGTRGEYWLVLLAAGGCGWVVASVGVAAVHRWELPTPKCVHPMPCVVIDRGLSNVPLANGLFTQGDNEGYGMLEAWIPRLGCYTVRKEGLEVFSGDALVVICPSRSVTPEYSEQLEKYVANGGKLLVIDSPENTASKADTPAAAFWTFDPSRSGVDGQTEYVLDLAGRRYHQRQRSGWRAAAWKTRQAHRCRHDQAWQRVGHGRSALDRFGTTSGWARTGC